MVEDSQGMGSGGLEGAKAFHFRAVSFSKSPLAWVRSEAPKGPTGEPPR